MTGAQEIVRRLGGHWRGRYGMARCPCHRDRTPSLKVTDGLDGEPILHCFGGCPWKCVKDALRRDGLLPERGAVSVQAMNGTSPDRKTMERRDAAERADKARRTRHALRIWRRCVPAQGTLAEKYLRGRSITLPIPPSIRFLPDARHQPTGLELPAMIGGVQGPDGRITGVHRTFLKADGSGKAPVSNARMMLGPCAGGAVRLGLAGRELAICEGIESALSFQQATQLTAWAALSVSGVRSLVLPKEIKAVVLGLDGDAPGDGAAVDAARRFVREGRRARIARPPRGMDWNDVLREPEKEMADA